MSHFKNIQIESEISKVVLKSIIENKKIDYKKLGILDLKKKILELQNIYNYKNKSKIKKLDYKYEIFWNIVEEKYNKKINIVKRNQRKKNKNYNIIYSDFANLLGFLPSLLTLLIFDSEINLLKYENLFDDLQKSGDNINFEQKNIFIKIKDNKIRLLLPYADITCLYWFRLYKYTFNSLNEGLGNRNN